MQEAVQAQAMGDPPAAEPQVYIGRQPIVDKTQSLVAFELLFRNADGAQPRDSAANAAVIVNAFTEFGVQETLGPQRGFLNVDRELLMSAALPALPANRIVLELLDTIAPDEAVIARCKALRGAGYRLALDHVTALDTRVKKLLPYASMVKLDAMDMDDALLARFVAALGRLPLLLIADRVETPERAAFCLELGFHLFQGYHFARPQIVEGKRAPPAKLALLNLTRLLNGDADAHALEDELKQHPDLAYNLLRIANSAAYGLTRKIDSLAQCIAVLGRSRLAQWVQLLLYAPGQAHGESANPLMHLAATRGKWMENLAAALRPADRRFHDLAFMVGIMSLLGTLLGMPLADIVRGLNLADEASAALLERKGELGAFLTLIERKESNDFPAVASALATMPRLTLAQFTAAELGAAAWAQAVAAA